MFIIHYIEIHYLQAFLTHRQHKNIVLPIKQCGTAVLMEGFHVVLS